MDKKTSIIVGVVIFFGFGFVSSSVVAAKKSSRTLVAYAEYPLASDQWYINTNISDAGRGTLSVAGRAFCRIKPGPENWKITLVRADGKVAEAKVETSLAFKYGFPFVGLSISAPEGYNAGLHIEELSSSTPHQAEFTCK